MTTRQLQDLLSDMADDVRPTSVHDKAVLQSRGIGMRRAAIASVAALTLIGGGVFGVAALADGPDGDRVVDPAEDVREIHGTYFVVDSGGQGDPERLVSWRVGDDEVTELANAESAGWGLFVRTGEVSPDGKHFSFLSPSPEEGGSAEDANSVMVMDLATKEIRKVADYSTTGDPCSPPMWSPDGERLYVDRGPGASGDRTGYVELASGDFTPLPIDEPCDLTVTTGDDGDDVVLSTARGDDGAEVYATTADGERTAVGAAAIAGADSRYITDLVAASADGRYLCVEPGLEKNEYHDGIKGRSDTCDFIIDTVDEETIVIDERNGAFPTGGPSMFVIPGRILLEGDDGDGGTTHLLRDVDGTVLDEIDSGLDDPALPRAFVPD